MHVKAAVGTVVNEVAQAETASPAVVAPESGAAENSWQHQQRQQQQQQGLSTRQHKVSKLQLRC